MTQFDLIGAIRTYCTANNIVFVTGAQDIREFEASKKTYSTGQLILFCFFSVNPTFTKGNTISEIEYTGLVMLGRKFEATTQSDLDETFIQKYDRRLLSLSSTLFSTLKSIACTNELTIQRATMQYKVNETDECIDFVEADVSIIQ